MSEKPILFSAPMVRAILDGRKTQTRRIVKPQPTEMDSGWFPGPPGDKRNAKHYASEAHLRKGLAEDFAPYRPGDLLYVRETWQAIHVYVDPETGYGDDLTHSHGIPKGPGTWWQITYEATDRHEKHKEDRGFPWRPSIHMPKWAARLWLRVVGVRAERLQEITEADARAEGVKQIPLHADCATADRERFPDGWIPKGTLLWEGYMPHRPAYRTTARDSFASLWDSINGHRGQPNSTIGYGWNENPWVWRIEFERIERNLK
jgi:hypothetical protein